MEHVLELVNEAGEGDLGVDWFVASAAAKLVVEHKVISLAESFEHFFWYERAFDQFLRTVDSGSTVNEK
jgi:hypothetical protein